MVGKLKGVLMGKIIKTILATEDNDPMGLLNTFEVFTPRKFKPSKPDNENFKDKEICKSKKIKKISPKNLSG